MKFERYSLLLLLLCASIASASDEQWTVDGAKRTGIVCVPADNQTRPTAGWPAVFVFHGHGGSAEQIRRQFKTDTLWPGAVVVYLQGLPTVGQITDPGGTRAGWESVDTSDKNRDLRLYDVVLKDLIDNQHIDPRRVFSTGHSNGGGFTFTLWAHRGDTLAAVAPSSSIAPHREWANLKPKPAMMSGGKNDPLVKFSWQTKMMDEIKTLNAISSPGKPWGTDGTWYDSSGKTPFATIIYDGGHAPPKDLGQRVVDFFKAVSPDAVK